MKKNCQIFRSAQNFGRGKIVNVPNYHKAFTLAEMLITLAIIGVVSAIVIPTVLKNYNDKKYNTARLKALKTFGEAGKMASINGEINGQASAKDFVNNVLSKYLKITKICDNAHPNDCGFPSQIQPSNPEAAKLPVDSTHLVKWNEVTCGTTNISSPTNDPAMSIVALTNDGFSAKIFYNPKCARTNMEIKGNDNCNDKQCTFYNVDATCMNVIYDMNGLKGPNHVGEDIGIVTVFWSGLNATSVAPGIIPYSVNTTGTTTANFANAPSVCAQKSTPKVKYTMPNIDELASLWLNSKLVSLPTAYYHSGSISSRSDGSWIVTYQCYRAPYWRGYQYRAWCVRR